MSSLGKRSTEWIDLTGSDDDENPPHTRKQARVNQPMTSQPRPTQSLSSRDPWNSSAETNEENDIIDLSQDVDEGFGWTCVGAIDGKIVGIRYYNGYATPGEQVMVRREPGNPYDSNAIRINNVQGTQIGHLPRNLAAKLTPYMVSRIVSLIGRTLKRDRIRGLWLLKGSLLVKRVNLTAPFYLRFLVLLSLLLVHSWKPR
jgi:SWI/SNF-related matrix-associated actin-dependent regulator of chromatin subfamily A3